MIDMAPSKAYTCRLPGDESRLIEHLATENAQTRASLLRRAFRYYTWENPDDLLGLSTSNHSGESNKSKPVSKEIQNRKALKSVSQTDADIIDTNPDKSLVGCTENGSTMKPTNIYDPIKDIDADS